jgi:hypothetical protein
MFLLDKWESYLLKKFLNSLLKHRRKGEVHRVTQKGTDWVI